MIAQTQMSMNTIVMDQTVVVHVVGKVCGR